MKLLWCPECKDVVSLILRETRVCKCGKTAGKYVSDCITAIITEGAVVFGIDNNTLSTALTRAEHFMKNPEYQSTRIDFFFTGWVPTKPGEVIVVKSPIHVKAYDYYDKRSWTSENPSTGLCEEFPTENAGNFTEEKKEL